MSCRRASVRRARPPLSPQPEPHGVLWQGQPCPVHPKGSPHTKSPDHTLAFPFLPRRTTPRWLEVGWLVFRSKMKCTAGSQNAEASLEENSISFPAAQHVSAEPQARSKLQAWSFWGTWHSRVTKLLEIKPLELPAAPKQPPAGSVSVNTAVALPGGTPAPGKHAEQRFQHLDFKINPWKLQACWHFQRRPPAFLTRI